MEESEVLRFLLGSGAEPSEVRNVLFPQLERKGFRKKADLKDMEDKDFEIEGIYYSLQNYTYTPYIYISIMGFLEHYSY